MENKYFFKLILIIKCILFCVLLFVFITITPTMSFDKLIVVGFVIYLNFTFLVATCNSKFNDLLGFSNDSDFYKTYLDLMIDTLQIADGAMNIILNSNSKHDCRVVESVEIINSCCNYLKTVEAPRKYKDYHNNVISDLDNFLLKYT